MPTTIALPQHIPQIHRLLQHGRHCYVNFSNEDLSSLLKKGGAVVGCVDDHDNSDLWGFLGIRIEGCSPALPPDAPYHAYIYGIVLARGRSPWADIATLLPLSIEQLQHHLSETPHSIQLVFYGSESWPIKPLQNAGFATSERVEFLYLDRLKRRTERNITDFVSQDNDIQLAPLAADEVDMLTQMDAETFEPLWHLSAKQLMALLLTCRVQVAKLDNRIVGYTALSLGAGTQAKEAHLARLAVHPHAQGRRIGRRLLMESIGYAVQSGAETLLLNTQTGNRSAQKLYRSVGFRSTGQVIPILTKYV